MSRWISVLLLAGNAALRCQNAAAPAGEQQIQAWYQEAQQAQGRRDFEGAIAAYGKILAARPDIAEIHSNLGLVYYLKGSYADAAASFERALDRKPDLYGAKLLGGIANAKLHNYRKAVPLLRDAVAVRPGEQEALLYLGIACAGSSQFEEAARHFEKLMAIQPRDVETLYQAGSNYLRLFSRSLEEMREAEPGSFLRYRALARFEAMESVTPDAIEERYLKAIENNPSFPNLHWDLAEARIQQGNWQGAEEALRAELRIHPDHLLAWLRLGEVLKNLDRQPEAPAAVERARAIARRIPKTDKQFQLLVSRDLRSAVDFLDTVAAVAESAAPLPFEANGFPHPRNLPGTLTRFWARLQATPGDARALEVYGRARMEQGNLKQLRDQLLRLRAGRGVTPMVHYLLAETYRRLALSAHRSMVEANPESYRAHQLLAEAYEAEHKDDHAIQEYRAAVAANPRVSGIHYALGTLLAIRQEFDGAIAAFEKELEVDPHQPLAMLQLGGIYIVQRKPEKALEYLDRALREDKDNPEILAVTGQAYRLSGKLDKAVEMFERAIELEPENASSHYQLAMLYGKLDRGDDAKKHMALFTRLKQKKSKKGGR